MKIPDHYLIAMMALHFAVWSFLWAAKGNSVYAALTGFALASLVFMVAWTRDANLRRKDIHDRAGR